MGHCRSLREWRSQQVQSNGQSGVSVRKNQQRQYAWDRAREEGAGKLTTAETNLELRGAIDGQSIFRLLTCGAQPMRASALLSFERR